MNWTRCVLALLAPALLAATAHAGLAPTYPLGSSAGTWEVDRYAPAVFSNAGTLLGRSNVLDLGLSSADSLANRPPAFQSTFYNTQGRGFQLTQPNYAVLYGSVYLPSAWASSASPAAYRRSDLWGVLSPSTGGDTCAGSACNIFPILGFTNADPAYPATTNPASGRYRVFDGNSGGFNDLATPVAYDQWSDLCIAWTGTDIRHYINGALVYVQSDLTQGDNSFGPPVKYTRMIIQGYNFGSAYDVNWSGVGAGTVTSATAGGGGQTTPPNSPFAQTLTITVVDAGGAPVPCVPVTFAVPGSGASATLSATTVLSDRNGDARVTATANSTSGSYAISTQIPGIASPPSIPLANAAAPVATPVPAMSPLAVALLALLLAALGLRGLAAQHRQRR